LFFESPQAQSAVTVGEDGRTLVVQGRNGIELDCASSLEFQARLATAVEGGHVKNAGDHLQIRGADSVALKMAVATSYVRFDDVTGDPDATTKANVSRVSAETYEQIASRAICRYRSVYDRVSIDLGSSRESHRPTDQRLLDYHNGAVDPSLSALYFQYGRYLLISSSWPGAQPANLQGIWNDSIRPPWGSKYTVNINTEMNYWPAESANLPEMVGPLFEMVRDLSITGRATAREMYGARGWVCHHNTDLWRATAPIDAPSYGLWPLGGAWLCMTLWDHYDYGRNPNYLASMYPILKGSCEFFIDTLTVSGLTGQLVMNPTMSPENVHGTGGASALCAGTTMDAQILRELFRVTAYSSLALGVEPDFRSQLTLFASKLRPTDVGKDGQIKEWDQDWDGQVPDLQHRHVSHLWGLYPGHQITIEKNSDLIDAARISLNIRGDEGPGWSTAWKMNLWARMRDSARAYSLHKRLLSPELCYPNMFDAHPPLDQNSTSCFQIDGNLGGVSGIIEMLVYSAGEDIVLLPALPIQWQTGSVRGIRLRGAWTIDIEWANGSPVVVCVYAHLDGTRSLRYGTHSISVKLLKGETRSISSF
jgi:alpha-L-fucosidase 2